MIVTVTLNPAVDVTYVVDRLVPGEVHRVREVVEHPGGKGINVARVLHQLGRPVTATGLLGGAVGDQIEAALDDLGLPARFARLTDGATRRCVTVVDTAGDETVGNVVNNIVHDIVDDPVGSTDTIVNNRATVLNEPGPLITPAGWTDAQQQMSAATAGASVVVMSGSLPRGVPPTAYADLAASNTPHRCLVDASGPGLLSAAAAGVGVLKPNAEELRDATGHADPVDGARTLLDAGAGAVVVTLGRAGMIAVTGDQVWRAHQPEHLVGNPTGAGDAAAAALAAGLAAGQAWPDMLREAVAWSAAAVPVAYAGEVDIPTLERLRPQVRVEETA